MGGLLQDLRLASPAWLGAMLLLPLVAVAVRGSLTRESVVRRVASLALRVAALALLILALASPVADRPNHLPWAALLVDQSESVGQEGAGEAKAFVEETLGQTNPERIVVVPFGVEPGEASVGKWPEADPGGVSGTDLLAALDGVASISRPLGPERIILLSDGGSTVPGDVVSAAVALQAPVDTVPLASRKETDAWVVGVTAPSEVRPGSTVSVSVQIASNVEGNATLVVTSGGKEIARKDVELVVGQVDVPFEFELAAGPRDVFRVTLELAGDPQQLNNWADFGIWHGVPARALLVGREPSLFSRFSRVLERHRIEAETTTADRFPRTLAELSKFDLVVLADVPASALAAEQLDAIEKYVRDKAGGLVVFGGQNSLTAGDYQGTALERVLPVVCEYDVQAKRPSLAMVLVIDQSGSMEEGNAIGLAKTALRQTVGMLDDKDALGVIAFQDTTEWVVPLQPCDNKEKVLREIETLQAGGGTNMHPAIAKAHLALHEAFADLKHIIVLTDGISYPGDFDTLASEVATSGITISTVAVGSEAAEPLLKTIAELGGGNYHHCTSAAEVPAIFVRETAKAARMGIREEPFFPKADATLNTIVSLPDDKPPTLLGYVQTKARADAQVGMVSESGDPLVAWWEFGRGRTAVFTSELSGAWTRPWQRWAGLEELWSALVGQTLRPFDLNEYQLGCRRQGDRTVVSLDAVPYPGRFENGAKVVAQVLPPGGAKRQVDMPLEAPGRYAVEVVTPEAGIYDFEVSCEVNGEVRFAGRCSACSDYPAEWIPGETNESLLRRVAEATGGRFSPTAGEVVSEEGVWSLETVSLGRYLLFAAIMVLIGELTIRRLRRGGAAGNG